MLVKEELLSLKNRLKYLELDLNLEKSKLQKLLKKQGDLSVEMPFDGVINTDTRSLLNSSYLKGESVLELVQTPLILLEAKLPEYMRSSLKINQAATARFYSSPFNSFSAKAIAINPSTINESGIPYVGVTLESPDIPNKMSLGSNGTIKVFNGITCLFISILRPILRFIFVDIWSWLP